MVKIWRDGLGCMHVRSIGKVVGSKDSGLVHRWAKKQIARIFPALGSVEGEETWHGSVARIRDHVLRGLERETNPFIPIGYNRCGITTGSLFDEAMAGLLKGWGRAGFRLVVTEMLTAPSAPLLARIYQPAFNANHIFRAP